MNRALSMMKLYLVLCLGFLDYLAAPLVTFAKQPVASLIGNIQNTKEI
jgi:hypothetical protein